MVYVMVLEGKGLDSADFVKVVSFDNKEDANAYINEITDMNSKYWKFAFVYTIGETVETYPER